MRQKTYQLVIKGRVQGVGFRPFVYTIATAAKLPGEVFNNDHGVEIRVQCSQSQAQQLAETIQDKAPVLARITSLEIVKISSSTLYKDFRIGSSDHGQAVSVVAPDICICADCLAEIHQPQERRFQYAFTNCTNCGPRFSIIQAMPYDRSRTCMTEFQMCARCQQEYQDFANRRFHAQPNACADCGPQLSLHQADGTLLAEYDQALVETVVLLQAGKIVAIKGIGGFHLACLATDSQAVKTLRKRKHRPDKPLAVMMPNVQITQQYCHVSALEQSLLQSHASPIVLVRAKKGLADAVAPGQGYCGVMLPYSPLHVLLMHHLQAPVVLTSGNKSGHPQVIDNAVALQDLAPLVDGFLLHNRAIVNRVDDSVVQVAGGQVQMIRRARGYAPTTLPLPPGFGGKSGLLAVGAELKNTFALVTSESVVVSQHIGDLKSLESYQDFVANIGLYTRLYQTKPGALSCDLHPDYLSSTYAQEYASTHQLPLTRVQHHHAHIAAGLFEYQAPIDCAPVLGVVWDGVGLGADGQAWGGEFLLADYRTFQRVAQLEAVPLLGGDKAAQEPWRMTYAYLRQHQLLTEAPVTLFADKPVQAMEVVWEHSILSSSIGRLFDAVAYLLGVVTVSAISYEAQAAIALEQLAWQHQAIAQEKPYSLEVCRNAQGRYRLETKLLWQQLLEDLAAGIPTAAMAYRFHMSLAQAFIQMVDCLHQEYRFDTVIATGGVFHNKLLVQLLTQSWENTTRPHLQLAKTLPLGDGAISVGQAAVAMARSE